MAATRPNNVNAAFTSRAQPSSYPAASPRAGTQSIGPMSSGSLNDGPGSLANGMNPGPASWVPGSDQPGFNCELLAGAGEQPPSRLVVFGDLLSDNGSAATVQKSLGNTPDYVLPPYSSTGDFSDGPKWTTDLARSLGLQPSQQQDFAYEGATGGSLGTAYSPVNPAGGLSPLDTFAGQVQQFEQGGSTFSSSDEVSVTFGGNDIFLASAEQLAGTASAHQVITDSVDAIILGMKQLAVDGAKHFLVSNSPDVTLAPIFKSAEFLASGATAAGIETLVDDFNTQLTAGLSTFKSQTGLDVKALDLHTLFNNIVADPSTYGFTNVTQPVISSIPGTTSSPVYDTAIDAQSPKVEHASLFMDPLFDTTERCQTLMALTARNTLLT